MTFAQCDQPSLVTNSQTVVKNQYTPEYAMFFSKYFLNQLYIFLILFKLITFKTLKMMYFVDIRITIYNTNSIVLFAEI